MVSMQAWRSSVGNGGQCRHHDHGYMSERASRSAVTDSLPGKWRAFSHRETPGVALAGVVDSRGKVNIAGKFNISYLI